MTNATAEMAKKSSLEETESKAVRPESGETGVESGALDRRYRQIGISAVAAAVRYQGLAKNPAYAPAQIDWRHLAKDAAA